MREYMWVHAHSYVYACTCRRREREPGSARFVGVTQEGSAHDGRPGGVRGASRRENQRAQVPYTLCLERNEPARRSVEQIGKVRIRIAPKGGLQRGLGVVFQFMESQMT